MNFHFHCNGHDNNLCEDPEVVTHLSIPASLTAQMRLIRRLDLKALIAARAGEIPIPVATSIWLSYNNA
jgi:hypothetical protein